MTTKQQRAREHNWLIARAESALATIKAIDWSLTATTTARHHARNAETEIIKMIQELKQRVDPTTGKVEFNGQR